ncbi:alpha/beta hydrolase family protein [candidate division KSB1 bacterium]
MKNNNYKKEGKQLLIFIFIFIFLLVNGKSVFGQQENLSILDKWIKWKDSDHMLINFLNRQAFDYLDLRDEEVSNLQTKTDWLKRQEKVKDILMKTVGPFPEKTPLNPKVTGVLKKDGYRVEKIIIESMPKFYVTGCLFIPDGLKGKAPAILKVIGHSQESFRAEGYQNVILNLVKKGFIVFAIDPIGQGEKQQYFDPFLNFSSVGYSVIEHCYFSNQCFLSGVSCARYFIWDAIRSIDYLLTRKDVDQERIGITGLSGGGTISSFMCAFDPRIKAAVPLDWPNANRRLVESCGIQGAEANIYLQFRNGITFADLLELRAPKPTLMVFTTRDYLNIQGAREAYKEIKKAYKAFGKEENIQMSEDDFKHYFTRKNNEATYAFFQKHLNLPGDPTEEEVEVLTYEELTVTPTGQISTYLGGENVTSLNMKETEKLINKIEDSRKNVEEHINSVRKKAKEISGFADPLCDTEPVFCGRYQRDGYCVEMYVLKGEKDYVIPLLLFVPKGIEESPAVIYIHPDGKIIDASAGGEIEKIVKKGFIVAAPDLLGIGETKTDRVIRPYKDDMVGVLIGRSVVGIQAGDIVRTVNFLKTLDNVDKEKIGAFAVDEMCLPLLHAAAFDESIKNIGLSGSLISYRSVVMNQKYKVDIIKRRNGNVHHPIEVDFASGIAGVLTGYDLPDLIGSIAPRKVVLAGLKNQMLEPASEELIEIETTFPRLVYSYKNVPRNLKIISSYKRPGSLVDWGFE